MEDSATSRPEMVVECRFQTTKEAFYHHAKIALVHRFTSDAELEIFYEKIVGNEEKLLFLETCTKYRLIVKDGDWICKLNDSHRVIDYITNSYKLLAIFALIESMANEKHIDFHDWLRERDDDFPITTKKNLSRLHQEYKATYGSIKKVVTFFERLTTDHQARLCGLLTKDKQPMESIKKLAQYLYDIRSKFAHEGKLAVQLHSGPMIQYRDKKSILINISMDDVTEAFELGLINRFRN
jgi:hypothetical protein